MERKITRTHLVIMLALGGFFGFAAGAVIMGQRYELRESGYSGYVWRVNKMSGVTDLIGPNGQPVTAPLK